MGDREVRREGERDEDQGWYPHEIEQSPSQCTKRRVSTAAIRILFRICFFFFHHTASFSFFFSFSLPETYKAHSHLDLIHQPKAFIYESSHTFASELPPEVLMLNSQTTDSADHLSPKLIWVIIIFWKDLWNHISRGNVEPRTIPKVLFPTCKRTHWHSRTHTHTHTLVYLFGGLALWNEARIFLQILFGSVYGYFRKLPRCRSGSKFRKLISNSTLICNVVTENWSELMK